ncbi:MAG: aminotransferase class I/II-fold pyridoxal phosphate-dependent enzyme [Spirulina sp. DLM2.Bin59]|nr:MAG: aminotransferase class I/II-fold pyridoxal phosphate-dependent enzyme [Spirulina sp. DLM2.Bin59]
MTAEGPLIAALKAAARWDHAPFYTPGHRRGVGLPAALKPLLGAAAAYDFPELPTIGNLAAEEGAICDSAPIAAAQTLAAQTFGAERTWFLVNGSSGGLLAAILATCGEGGKIILPRNVHSSIINGLILAGAWPVFIHPAYGAEQDLAYGMTAAAVAEALATHPDVRAVLVVYPTYHGICTDLAAIAEVVHGHGIPLLVDEAHGPHFAFHPDLPPSALSLGADLVVQSTHKVLGALSQAAMLHGQGDRLHWPRLAQCIAMVQSTSPNSLLLASLDGARQQMATAGRELMAQTLALAQWARQELAQIPHVTLLETPSTPQSGFRYFDPTRLTVLVAGLGRDGFDLDEELMARGVMAELPLERHLMFIVTLGSCQQDLDRLVAVFRVLSQETTGPLPTLPPQALPPLPPLLLSPRAATFAPRRAVPLDAAVGEASGALICAYPPGIPVFMPGEMITEEAIAYLQTLKRLGAQLLGLSDPTLATLSVIDQLSRLPH